MSDLVRLCPRCGTICVPLNTRCSRCDADISQLGPVSLRDLVEPAGLDEPPASEVDPDRLED